MDEANLDVIVRLTQDRALHTQDLARLYMHALHDDADGACVAKLEAVLARREVANEKKMVVDAANMSSRAQNQRLHAHLVKMLEKDRKLHETELHRLRAHVPKGCRVAQVLETMIDARATNNAARTKHDMMLAGGGEGEDGVGQLMDGPVFYSQEAKQLWDQINE